MLLDKNRLPRWGKVKRHIYFYKEVAPLEQIVVHIHILIVQKNQAST
jgi:hypothetical protein